MDDITKDQKEVINELRRRTVNDCTPKMLEDVSLFYRFAKARDFNLEDAEVMLRNHIAWRKELQIDTITKDYKPLEVHVKYAATTFLCFDKEGSVVRLNDSGRADLKGLWNSSNKAELSKYCCYVAEQDKERVIQNGGNFKTPLYSIIYDLENFSYSIAVSLKTMQFSLYNTKIFLDNYPETIKQITVINAPSYFAWFYAAIKPILPATVIQKVKIYGADGWKDRLLELVDADDLPAYLGGNKTDPDGNPLCKTFINRGQPIPKRYYKTERCNKLPHEPNVDTLTVMPLSKEEITFEVTEENSYLKWEFETKNKDIGFSLVFTEKSAEDFKRVQLIPKQRIDTSDDPETGCFKCEKVGNYTILFDNSFSWIHSKEIYYRAGIQGPKNTDIYEGT